ncbi:protein TsetseEP-like [Calliphora vicina]|uniref:protein TsetseEP-like n=1 Tax=Calliphora vicina TaxID=7373 RepID=UPI00325AD8C0
MFSKLKILFTLLAAFTIIECVAAQRPHADVNVLQLIARSTDLMANNPRGSSNCFSYYVNEMGEITTKYETDYDNCCNLAKNQRLNVELDTADSRESFGNRTQKSCDALTQCKEESSVDGEYQCYIYEGNDNAKVLHDISNEAFIEFAEFLEKIRIIENNENICTNETRKVYEDESWDAYVNLDDCLKGRKEPPTPKPTPEPTPKPTAEPTPEPTPSPEPSTTTEETTTESEEITTTPEDEDDF